MRAAFISNSDCGRHDTGWGHPEHVGRLRAITRALREDPEFFHSVDHLEGRHATIEELELAHDPSYVRSVLEIAEHGSRDGCAGLVRRPEVPHYVDDHRRFPRPDH